MSALDQFPSYESMPKEQRARIFIAGMSYMVKQWNLKADEMNRDRVIKISDYSPMTILKNSALNAIHDEKYGIPAELTDGNPEIEKYFIEHDWRAFESADDTLANSDYVDAILLLNTVNDEFMNLAIRSIEGAAEKLRGEIMITKEDTMLEEFNKMLFSTMESAYSAVKALRVRFK